MIAKTSSSFSKKTRQFFDKFLGENIFKIIASVPGQVPKSYFKKISLTLSIWWLRYESLATKPPPFKSAIWSETRLVKIDQLIGQYGYVRLG
jgi:hypothetical protein